MSEDKASATGRKPADARLANAGLPATQRLRVTFAKTEAMRYTSHLDLHRAWERTIRRAGLPLAYSQGYNRHPRLQLAMALPLGITGEGELLDAWFESALDLSEARIALKRSAPPGLQLLAVEEAGLREPPLQTRIRSAVYSVTLLDPVPELDSRIAALLASRALPRERRDKAYDLRPLIEGLSQIAPNEQGQVRLCMQLAAREGQTGRPDEVLMAMGIPPESARAHRLRLILDEQTGEALLSKQEDG